MKYFTKPDIWITLFCLSFPFILFLVFLHLITLGAFKGINVVQDWGDFILNKSMKNEN